ncbi:hypothetical protein PHO31112_04750 [Pandoraea horticolens]|uniref:Uncharacterized protein n=1 Tax=Pandoraea horticolens TaxID=2508298 RepID=A0A5E4YU30_9BURK|nr:hypothetical protein [Pandoraea horticolens]VVE51938.1 hypothetical protein PHO31112_04750 [Pandoraea horticolens]
MQIFGTGHDVRAYARNHDGISLKAQRTSDSETVRNIIRDYSGNAVFLQRAASTIHYLHKQLNLEKSSEEISVLSVANRLDGTDEPWPNSAQREHMAAALIRLCTRRHATFDRLFRSKSNFPHHIAEILQDLPLDAGLQEDLPLDTTLQGEHELPRVQPLVLQGQALIAQLSVECEVSRSTGNYEISQTKREFEAQGFEQEVRGGPTGLVEPATSSMSEQISETVNVSLTAMSDLITSFGETDGGKRDIINSFLSEIYFREMKEFSDRLLKEISIEYLKEIGSIAKDAGLDMRQADFAGVLVPKAQGTDVFRTFVETSCQSLGKVNASTWLNDMRPEIARRVHQDGLRLVVPMAEELGYLDPTTFRDRLRGAASRFLPSINNAEPHGIKGTDTSPHGVDGPEK